MTKCKVCGKIILFGAKKTGDMTFCSEKCQQKGHYLSRVDQIPADLLEARVNAVHKGNCPKCGGAGPVDVHTSHKIWSALYLSSWSSQPQLSCRSCGLKKQIGMSAFSLFLGWWAIPWGIILTPVQIGRNISGMVRPPDPNVPSEKLRELVKIDIAREIDKYGQPQVVVPPIAEPFAQKTLSAPKPPIAEPFTQKDAFKN